MECSFDPKKPLKNSPCSRTSAKYGKCVKSRDTRSRSNRYVVKSRDTRSKSSRDEVKSRDTQSWSSRDVVKSRDTRSSRDECDIQLKAA